ncbi:MAG TPA: NAD-dependent epimerase/dehydratase family protein [Bryobacteraceae bacterium]
MRILVTGATGFLGFHVCERLASQNHAVTAFHRQGSRTELLDAIGIRRAQGNLNDLDEFRAAVRGQDVVIHAAADIQYWPRDVNEQERVNVGGARNVAHACRLEGVSRMLHVSSVCAVGIPEDRHCPADENFVFNLKRTPLLYHLSKKAGEDAVLGEVSKGLDAVIVNPSSVFGPYGLTYRLGEMIRKVGAGAIAPYFTGGICAVHVGDVVDGMLAALERGSKGSRYILGGENLSYREIARRSLIALGLRRPLVPVPSLVTALAARVASFRRGQGRPRFNPANHYTSSRFQYYASDKARRELGYAPRGFDAIIQECLSS